MIELLIGVVAKTPRNKPHATLRGVNQQISHHMRQVGILNGRQSDKRNRRRAASSTSK